MKISFTKFYRVKFKRFVIYIYNILIVLFISKLINFSLQYVILISSLLHISSGYNEIRFIKNRKFPVAKNCYSPIYCQIIKDTSTMFAKSSTTFTKISILLGSFLKSKTLLTFKSF